MSNPAFFDPRWVDDLSWKVQLQCRAHDTFSEKFP